MPQHSGAVTAHEVRSGVTNDRAWAAHNLTIGGARMSSFEKALVQPLIDAVGTDQIFTIGYSQNDKGYKTIEGVTEGRSTAQNADSATEPAQATPTITRAETLHIAVWGLAVQAAAMGSPPGDDQSQAIGDCIDSWVRWFGPRVMGKVQPRPNTPSVAPGGPQRNANPPAVQTPIIDNPTPTAGGQPSWLPVNAGEWTRWVKQHEIPGELVRRALRGSTLTEWLEADPVRTEQGAASVVWQQHAGVAVLGQPRPPRSPAELADLDYDMQNG